MKRIILLLFIGMTLVSCIQNPHKQTVVKPAKDFDPSVLRSDMLPAKEVSGQLLYLPVYSNIPYEIDTVLFDMSAFVAIHNIDLDSDISLTKVLYFNQEGGLVDDFLPQGKMRIKPLATRNFYIPYDDKSGTGANFLIEWIADSAVCEPLIESVTLCLKPNNTISIVSQGRIIRERK